MIEFIPLQALGGLEDLFGSFTVFTTMNVLFMTGFGAVTSGSATVGVYAGYLTFAWIALNASSTLYTNIVYVSVALIFVGVGFKLVRTEVLGGGSAG